MPAVPAVLAVAATALLVRRLRPGSAQRVPVRGDEPLAPPRWDYADAFEVCVAQSDGRTAEQWARDGLERAPWPVRQVVLLAHRHVLRFRLGPLSAPDHVLGWQVRVSEPDAVHLAASSPLLDGHIVGRRVSPGCVQLRTYVVHRRPVMRWVWAAVGPVHRAVAPYLLSRAARG